jgi:hypothetical protein
VMIGCLPHPNVGDPGGVELDIVEAQPDAVFELQEQRLEMLFDQAEPRIDGESEKLGGCLYEHEAGECCLKWLFSLDFTGVIHYYLLVATIRVKAHF